MYIQQMRTLVVCDGCDLEGPPADNEEMAMLEATIVGFVDDEGRHLCVLCSSLPEE